MRLTQIRFKCLIRGKYESIILDVYIFKVIVLFRVRMNLEGREAKAKDHQEAIGIFNRKDDDTLDHGSGSESEGKRIVFVYILEQEVCC